MSSWWIFIIWEELVSDRFIQHNFLRICRRVESFMRGNGSMDVIYVGQLSPAWGFSGHALSRFPQIWRVLTPFLVWLNFTQNKAPNKRTLMGRFGCGNILLIGDFKSAIAYQNMWGNMWSDHSNCQLFSPNTLT